MPEDDEMYSGVTNKFEATKISTLGKCENIETYTYGLTGSFKKYTLLKTQIITDKKSIDDIDKLVRQSSLMGPNATSIMGGFKLSEVKPKLDKVIAAPFKSLTAYIALYSADKVSKGGYGYAVRALVVNGKTFAFPSKGVPEFDLVLLFQIDDHNLLRTKTHCGECDAWSGYDIFEISDSSVKLVHTTIDLLPTPE